MAPSPSIPAVAVIGAGSFGRNHLRVYRELEAAGHCRLAAAVDASAAAREAAADAYAVPAFASVDDLLSAGLPLDAASVALPTRHHAQAALQLLAAGVDTLIEKPFAATLAEADAVIESAARHSRVVAIGHLERFNPAVTAAAERRTRPMFFESHRLSIFTPRSLDVDVVLDLMIHDLDIVLTLAASEVTELRAVGLPVLSGRTDIANIRVEFRSGAVANFTASRVSTEQVRKLRFFQPHQYLSLDFARQELLSIDIDPAAVAAALTGNLPMNASSAQTAPGHPSAGLALHKLELTRAEPLRLELEDFLHAVTSRGTPRVTAQAGRAALALALDINSAIEQHRRQTGL